MYAMMKTKLENLDLVYILGKGSRWFDNELRFSLRSACENLPHRRVILVGEKPEWIRNVLHIPAVDDMGCKLKNAMAKIKILCETEGVSEDFVLMNDDFFIMRPMTSIPNYTNGTLKSFADTHETGRGYYYAAIQVTRTMLKFSIEVEPKNFELHVPMIFNRKKFLNLTDAIFWKEKSYLFRSVYGNVFELEGEDRDDIKIYRAKNLHDCDKMDLISTDNPTVLSPRFQKWIARKFPKKCKYEQ